MSSTEFSTFGTYEDGRNSLYERITDAWGNMRLSTRRLVMEEPSEARLLFYVLMSDMIFFVSWSVKTILAPTEQATRQLPEEIALWLIVALFCRSFAMYFFSILLGSGARILGGKASWGLRFFGAHWSQLHLVSCLRLSQSF